jgi:ATPase subunit of ABC transporter with duplicated ATPase domains
MLIISHDRYFLDNVTNKTIELEHSKTMCYKGSYSTVRRYVRERHDEFELEEMFLDGEDFLDFV